MYPSSITLPYQLGKHDATLLLHLPYEFEQAAMVGPVARDDVRSTT
jgi:hypothetical protein